MLPYETCVEALEELVHDPEYFPSSLLPFLKRAEQRYQARKAGELTVIEPEFEVESDEEVLSVTDFFSQVKIPFLNKIHKSLEKLLYQLLTGKTRWWEIVKI